MKKITISNTFNNKSKPKLYKPKFKSMPRTRFKTKRNNKNNNN